MKVFGIIILILLISSSCTQVKETKLREVRDKKDTSEIVYQCDPCGCDSDGKQFEHPGNCPSCGMKLIARTEPYKPLKSLDEPMNVAILLFHHAQVLDYAGPYDVFVSVGSANFNVYTVGETSEPIITMPNLSINPEYTLSNCPQARYSYYSRWYVEIC